MRKTPWTRLLALMLSCLLAAACFPLTLAESAATPERTLTISFGGGGSELNFMDAVEAFQALHPNVEIRLVEGSNSNPDAHAWYADALSSYESGADLIWCCSTSVDLQALMDKNLVAPLTDKALIDDVRSMYPQVADFVMRENMLYAYPVEIWPGHDSINPGLLQKLNLGPVPETVDEYMDLVYAWYTAEEYPQRIATYQLDYAITLEDEKEHVWSRLMIAYLHYLCEGKSADEMEGFTFDTPKFRKLLESYKCIWSLEPSAEVVASAGKKQQIIDDLLYVTFLEDGQEVWMSPKAAFNEDDYYHGPLTWFMLHPQSPNQDIAMEFLKYYSEHPNWRSAFELHPDAQSDKYPEALAAVYHEVAPHYCLGACSRYNRIILWDLEDDYSFVSAYCAGYLTADMLIETFDLYLNNGLSKIQ